MDLKKWKYKNNKKQNIQAEKSLFSHSSKKYLIFVVKMILY